MEGFEPSSSVPTLSQIEGAEAFLGVRFPASYHQVLLEFNGAYGGATFSMLGKEHGGGIGVWLSLLPWDSESIWATLSTWPEHKLPTEVVPFGEDGGGNYVCFDYRHSDVPSVVVWYHELVGEDGIFPVADTFDDFLQLLRADVD